MLLSFFIVWLCINLVCSIPDAALKFPRENAGKVSQKCHSACVIQRTTGNLNEKRAYPQEKILWIGSFLISSIATRLKTRYDQIGQMASDQFKTLPTVGSGRKFYLSWKAASSTISSSSCWNSAPALRSWAAKSASRLTRSISSWTWCFTTGSCAASSSLRRTACRITSSNLTKFYTRTLLHNQPITSHSKPRTTQARSGPVPGKMPVTPPPVLVSVNPQLRLTVQNPKTRSVWLWLPNSLPAARSWSPRLAPR